MDNNAVLAHYTGFNAFDGIFSNGEIWLNDCRYMNDSKEMYYLIESLIEEALKELTDSEKRFVKEEFVRQKEKRKNEFAYVTCLSRNIDEASQWDRYGRKGWGICIEFNQYYLSQLVSDNLVMQDVWYLTEGFSQAHKKIIVEWAKDPAHKVGGGLDDVDGLFENIWGKSMLYKHPSFRLENEVRITSFPFKNHKVLNDDGKYFSERYIITDTGIKKCLIMKWKDLAKEKNIEIPQLIHRILIGANSKTNISTLQNYMETVDLKCLNDKIAKSECPLR